MDSAIKNKMKRGPLHSHLWMKKALPLFRICWFFWLNFCGRDNSSGVYVNDLSFTRIFKIWFWIKVWLPDFDLGHQWLFWATFLSVVLGNILEIAPFFDVLLCLPVPLLFLCLGLVFKRLFVRAIFVMLGCCGFVDPNSCLFWCLNFCSILTTYR